MIQAVTWSDVRNLRGWRRYVAAVGVVVGATLVAELLYRTLETTRLSMIFLAGVLFAAVWLGSGPAFLAAAIAFVIYDFYLADPRFTLQFASPEDVIILAVFLIVALLTGGLAGRVRDAARRAELRAQTTGALLAASREFARSTDEAGVREQLVIHLAAAAKGEAAVWDGERLIAFPPSTEPPAALLLEADVSEDPEVFAPSRQADGWSARAIWAEDGTLGAAAWRPGRGHAPETAEPVLINLLIDMAATAISRARLVGAQAEAESLAKTERLRNALLSSVSHDLRTPLASILASASSLREYGDRFTPAVRVDLATTIQQEAERLNLFVANLLNFTRLEAGALQPDLSPIHLPELIDRLVARIEPRRGGRRVRTDYGDRRAVALGDPMLLEQALANVMENAIRYSPDESEIVVRVRCGDRVRISVADTGPGVPASELELIFEKFFRGQGPATRGQGTGLGLSITRGFIEAMGGSVRAEPGENGAGLVVIAELPSAEAEA